MCLTIIIFIFIIIIIYFNIINQCYYCVVYQLLLNIEKEKKNCKENYFLKIICKIL